MKIGIVVPGFAAHERDWCLPAYLDHVRALAAHAEVHVFTLRWPERAGVYSVHGAQVHGMDGRKRLGVRVLGLWSRTLSALAEEHRLSPFTVLHGIFLDEPALVAAWAGRWLGVPVVLSVTGGELMNMPSIGYGLQRLRGRRQLSQAALSRASCITVGSRYLHSLVSEFVRPEIRHRVVCAPFGVDTVRFSPGRESRDVPSGPCLTVGSLTPVKNPALALDVMAGTTHHLVVAGAGPLRSQLEQRARSLGVADRVQWLGAVPHAIMSPVYRASSLLLHTARHEAQGMVLLEAAASGIPVAGVAVGVLPELVPSGWSLPSPDGGDVTTGALIDLLTSLFSQPRLRRDAAEHARSVVCERFSLDVTTERFLEIYAAPDKVAAVHAPASPTRSEARAAGKSG